MAVRKKTGTRSTMPAVVTVLAGLALAASADVILSTGASNTCPDGYGKITVESECIVAMTALGIASGEYQGGETESSWPAGCYFCDGVNGCIDGVWFNTHGTGSGASGGANICASVEPPTVPPPPPPTIASADVILSTGASNTCPDGYGKITVESECIVAMTALGIASGEYQGGETESSWPAGCYFCDGVNGCIDGVWFNTHSTGSGASGGANICASVGPPTVPPPPTTAPPPGVLFVGDSDIERWTTAGVFPGSANVGVGGWTCNNVANQIDGFLATHTPTEVVLVCGENDLGNGASVATTFSRFSQVVASITNTGARVVYMGTKPEPDTTSFHDEYREYDALIRGLAIDLSAAAGSSAGPPPLAMVDVYPSFTALGNPSSLYANDGLHLSNAGYSYWNSWAATALAAAAGPCTLWESGVCTPTNPPTNPLPPTTPPTNPPPTNEPPCTACDLGATNAACSSGGQCCSGQCKRRRCKRGFVETCFPPTPPPPTPAPAAGPPPTTAPPLCGNPGDFCTSNSMCCGNCNNRKQKCR